MSRSEFESTSLLSSRIHELWSRSVNAGICTATSFLTPAEQYEVTGLARQNGYDNLYLFGGCKNSERKIAFFLPEYMDRADFEASDFICAFHAVSKFASPSHRDYLGAILGLGIKREFVGDIYLSGDDAYFYCLPTVAKHIALSLDKVGRAGVKIQQVSLADVPPREVRTKSVQFTVKSPRLDAVAAGLFSISRAAAADRIAAGAVSLNYSVCLKADAAVAPEDILSIRGIGKGHIVSFGGRSRKDRVFVSGEVYL